MDFQGRAGLRYLIVGPMRSCLRYSTPLLTGVGVKRGERGGLALPKG